jgi:cytochrome c oxidase assembly factor CtaG
MTMTLALLHQETFSWQEWTVYPQFMVGWLLLGAAYFLLIGPLRGRFPGSEPVPAKKVASFSFALAAMFLSLQGPLHELSDYFLFSAHMVQHLVLILVMPPFLLYGIRTGCCAPRCGCGRWRSWRGCSPFPSWRSRSTTPSSWRGTFRVRTT